MWVPLIAVLIGLALAGCGEESGDPVPAPSRASVCDIAQGGYEQEEVVVSGEAWALPAFTRDVGFGLAEAGCSLLIAAERTDAFPARHGDVVEVTGRVRELQSVELEALKRSPGAARARLQLDGAPDLALRLGSPFVQSYSVTGEQVSD